MAPAAKEASKKDGKKGDAKAKDSVEKEPSVELTEEEHDNEMEGEAPAPPHEETALTLSSLFASTRPRNGIKATSKLHQPHRSNIDATLQ